PPLATSAPVPRSVALTLVPIRTVGTDEALGAAAEGLTDELAARLGRLPGVGLTAGLDASNSADSASASVPAPGSQPTALRVDGSLRRERDRVRASVRVVVVRVDSTAWSGAFEGSMDSLFEFQTRVTDATFAAVNAVRRGLSEQ